MADRMGSYHGAFYLAGSTVILGAAIPFILFFVKRPIAHHEDSRQIVTHNIQESDLACHDNLSFVGELDSNQGTTAQTDSPCGDVKREMIDTPLAGVNDTVLPCAEEGSCSNIKSAENNNNPPLLLDAGTDTSETKARGDELIANDTKTRETLQPNAYQVEVQINSPLASTSTVDNEQQETTQQLVHDTKF